jgi:hypothetical protein
MVYSVISKIFTANEMIAGTAPTAFLATLTITTFHSANATALGNGTVLYSITYE